MDYRKWFKISLYLGTILLFVSILYFSWLIIKGVPFQYFEIFFNLLPGLILIFLGYFGPVLFDRSSQFPTAIFCPRCNGLTDKNPCTHCGWDILDPSPPSSAKNDAIQEGEKEKGLKKQLIEFISRRKVILFLILTFILILIFFK